MIIAGTSCRVRDSAAVGSISKNQQLRSRGGPRISASNDPDSPLESVTDARTKLRLNRLGRPEQLPHQTSSGDNRLSLAHVRRPTQADCQKAEIWVHALRYGAGTVTSRVNSLRRVTSDQVSPGGNSRTAQQVRESQAETSSQMDTPLRVVADQWVGTTVWAFSPAEPNGGTLG